MHYGGVITLIVTCVTYIQFARTTEESIEMEEIETTTEQLDESPERNIEDDHTFVALIDIVFTDASKLTCTGSIIHDNVVITTAHCFVKENSGVYPELTTSFVVIGTKTMFASSYERYLPMERVITHPKFNGWTADLALVYTFAGMISDKPGSIIPLAGVKIPTHVDSNVTVLSWGSMQDINTYYDEPVTPMKQVTECDSASIQETEEEERTFEFTKRAAEKVTIGIILERSRINPEPIVSKRKNKLIKETKTRYHLQSKPPQKTQHKLQDSRQEASQKPKLISRYLSREGRVSVLPKQKYSKHSFAQNHQAEISVQNDKARINYEILTEKNIRKNRRRLEDKAETDVELVSYYKNWRRTMGKQNNKLTVENFGFVNILTCKKIVEKAMLPRKFDISDSSDIVCYTAQNHVITDEDSGAPAVRRGHLIAVTMGGVEVDGDRIALGMKMTCYCSWISDNLPRKFKNKTVARKIRKVKKSKRHLQKFDKTEQRGRQRKTKMLQELL